MAYSIEKKLVVGVSSNALFNLEKEDEIFKTNGLKAYNRYQEQNKKKILEKGLAFPFIRRFLNINKVYKAEQPVEVVLMSKNSRSSTGNLRIHSIHLHIRQLEMHLSKSLWSRAGRVI